MSSMTDYLENKIVDWLFRGQSFVPPGSLYIGLFTAAPTDAGGGTEVAGGAYARAAVGAALAAWAGTQAAGSTVVSVGSSGTTSNNGAIAFPTPAASWGSVTAFGIFDAASAGNLLFYGALVLPKTINNGDPAPSFAAGALTVQIDD